MQQIFCSKYKYDMLDLAGEGGTSSMAQGGGLTNTPENLLECLAKVAIPLEQKLKVPTQARLNVPDLPEMALLSTITNDVIQINNSCNEHYEQLR